MKKLYASLLSFVLLIQFSSCKKEVVTIFDFSQYTTTDSNCLYTGAVDNSDWTNDAVWTTKENSLMNFSDNIVLTDSLAGYIEVAAPCSNPSEGQFSMGINTERQCKMKVVCVNTEMETLYFAARELTGGPVVTEYNFRSLTSFHKGMNYRMYYAFYTAKDSVYYKGHGDFRIE